jgi:hypothetical protein
MGWDSNPRRTCARAGFQDRCLKPLGHPSNRLIYLTFSSAGPRPQIVMLPKLVPNWSATRFAAYYSTPEGGIEARCRVFLHRRGDVRVEVEGDGDGRTAEAFLRYLRMHLRGQDSRGATMP